VPRSDHERFFAYPSSSTFIYHPTNRLYTVVKGTIEKPIISWSRDSAVGIATGYGLDDRGVGVRVPVGSRIFFYSTSSRPALGPMQPLIQWVSRALSPGVKRPGSEADHKPPTSGSTHPLDHTSSWCSA
jgi:hypothetical protein